MQYHVKLKIMRLGENKFIHNTHIMGTEKLTLGD